jgi:hypothetical protein
MPDCQQPLAVLQVARLTHLNVRVIPRVCDLEHSRIDSAIHSQRLGVDLAPVGKLDLGIQVLPTNHVSRSQHIAIPRHDHATSLSGANLNVDDRRQQFGHQLAGPLFQNLQLLDIGGSLARKKKG